MLSWIVWPKPKSFQKVEKSKIENGTQVFSSYRLKGKFFQKIRILYNHSENKVKGCVTLKSSQFRWNWLELKEIISLDFVKLSLLTGIFADFKLLTKFKVWALLTQNPFQFTVNPYQAHCKNLTNFSVWFEGWWKEDTFNCIQK